MSSLIGLWFFVGMIYNGHWSDPLNPNLRIIYYFENVSENWLTYYREDEAGYCRRKAEYSIQGNLLIQTITQVDEKNNISCGQDTDMRLGNVSQTSFLVQGDRLYLQVPLGEEKIQLVFVRQEDLEGP